MSVEENEALVRRFFEARVKTDLDALDKMLAAEFLSPTRVLAGHRPDREGYKRMSLEYAATFFQAQVHSRGAASRSREGAYPLQRARNP